MPIFRVLLAGLGGFAKVHFKSLELLDSKGLLRFVGACDPDPILVAQASEAARAAGRDVAFFPDYQAMLTALSGSADVVVLPTPITLHADMHRMAVDAGLSVYLEKPPTLDPAELERMIVTDQAARYATLVGFNFMIEPKRLDLKRRLLSGEFGAIRNVTLRACWSRPRDYFTRNSWAGRLRTSDGRVLLDSCLGNAMAHLVHNALHWCGDEGLDSWASPISVSSRLARAHDIECADTVFISARLHTGVTLRIALSHLGLRVEEQEERVECERAVLSYQIGSHCVISWRDGREETIPLGHFDAVHENHLGYLRYLNGEEPRPATSLIDSRPFVALNALAYLSADRIHVLPVQNVRWHQGADRRVFAEVEDLNYVLKTFCDHGAWPDEWLGLETGTQPPHEVDPESMPRLYAHLSRLEVVTRSVEVG